MRTDKKVVNQTISSFLLDFHKIGTAVKSITVTATIFFYKKKKKLKNQKLKKNFKITPRLKFSSHFLFIKI